MHELDQVRWLNREIRGVGGGDAIHTTEGGQRGNGEYPFRTRHTIAGDEGGTFLLRKLPRQPFQDERLDIEHGILKVLPGQLKIAIKLPRPYLDHAKFRVW